MMEQQRLMLDREDKLRQSADKLREEAAEARGRAEMQPKLEAQRNEADAKLERQRLATEARLEAQMRQAEEAKEEAKPQPACEAILEEELRRLGGRLTAMHAAELLTDEQLWTMEDIVADCALVLASATVTDSAVDKVLQMLRLSASIEADGALARQLRRRFAT